MFSRQYSFLIWKMSAIFLQKTHILVHKALCIGCWFRKLASLEEQNRDLISVNAKREEALQQTAVCILLLLPPLKGGGYVFTTVCLSVCLCRYPLLYDCNFCLETQINSGSKVPFIATQLNSTRRRVELRRRGVQSDTTQLNSTQLPVVDPS